MNYQTRESGVFTGHGRVPVKIVLHKHGKNDWVTHYQNVDTGEYFWGNYFTKYLDALRDFHARVAKLEKEKGMPSFSGMSALASHPKKYPYSEYDHDELLLWIDNTEELYDRKMMMFKSWKKRIKPLGYQQKINAAKRLARGVAREYMGVRFRKEDYLKVAEELVEEYQNLYQ